MLASADTLVGREGELEAARALMERPVRLLTLWGPPGIGKTSLAHALVADEPSATFVSLESAQGLEGLEAAVTPHLARHSGGWLVLDNLEHLLDDEVDGPAVTQRLQRWLADTPQSVSFLVTSRRRVRLPEEHSLALQPLDAEHSLELFVRLVRRHRADFTPTADREALLELVHALDGLPLALELAAARWDLLGTRGLLKRLSESLSVLARPGHVDPRHAALRQAIAWSWDLLDEGDRHALQAAAVFGGRFSVADAEALLGEVALDRLESLRESALVQVPTPGRFELLASIKQFAREHTEPGRAAVLADAHATWLMERFPDVDGVLHGVIEVSSDLLAAARFLVARDDPRTDHVLELLVAASPGYHLGLLDDAVARRDTARKRLARSRALRTAGRLVEAGVDTEAGLAMAPDIATEGLLHVIAGALAIDRTDPVEAETRFERALECARQSGNRRAEAMATANLAVTDSRHGRLEACERRTMEAIEGFRAVGDRRGEANVLMNLGALWQRQGLLVEAEGAFRDAFALTTQEGDDRLSAFLEDNLGLVYHQMGRLDEALVAHRAARERMRGLPDVRALVMCLGRLAAVEAALGLIADARAHLDEAARRAAPLRDDVTTACVELYRAFLDQALGRDDEVARRLEDVRKQPRGATLALTAQAILRQKIGAAGPALEVGEDWFVPPDGERTELARFASLRGMFQALLEQRETPDAEPLDLDALFAAGWPGEHIAHESIRNRVHVNLAKLRSLGLRDLLLRKGEGYFLDPAVPLRRNTGESAV